MTGMKFWALSLLAFLSSAEAAVRQYTLELTNDIVAPDGFPRRAVTVNHQLPGSIITANKNDQLQIEVVNNLNDSTMAQGTSVHWHGIFQNRQASEDGVAWVSQCPIAAGDRFLYNFNVGEQTGTYWYHSHVSTQYCDGLLGPLIIYDPNDPLKSLYDVDDESTVITLMDWYHLPSPKVLQTFGFPASHLINGRGREPDSNVSVALSVVNVDPMKRYRFRLINGACFAAYNFSIDGHDMTVIETDGVETIPRTVGVVSLLAGQRVSVVVNAFKPIGNYWIRSVPYTLGVPPSNETGVNSAILHYTGADDSEPTTVQTNFDLLREQDLTPFIPSDLSHGEPDVKINLVVATIGGPKGNFTVNGVQYTPPKLPLLLQILSGTVSPHGYLPKGTTYTLPRNKLVEISIPGDSPLAPHPFHLHGQNFAVTRSAGTTEVNTWNPPVRDVVSGGFAGDNITFRFRTDNPGPWFLHCHIDFHLDVGLAVVFAEDPQDQIAGPYAEEVTQEWENLCPKWNLLKNGEAVQY
ncbi:Cu-oxidase-domain-containing protein [Amanita rubescens]|nr:Cu-oxidase-domain-containing protein [Amanita rubescens]